MGHPSIINFAMLIFHNMLERESSGSKEDIIKSGGVELFVRLLDGNNVKILTVVCDCLKTLTTKNDVAKVCEKTRTLGY